MRSRRQYLGRPFDVWDVSEDRQAWFWLVIDSHRDRGMIGSAATEADAVREACASIEEISSQRRAEIIVSQAFSYTSNVTRGAHSGWTGSLDRLAEYLVNV